MTDRPKKVPVTAANPCPACKKPDWCLVAPDGSACLCQRVESPKRCGGAGWLHELAPTPPRPPRPPRPAGPPDDWPARAAALAPALTPDRAAELAAALRLPVAALAALPLIGYGTDETVRKYAGRVVPGVVPYFAFPEVDAAGAVVGITRRYRDGRKKMLPGGHRGLTLPAGWRDRPGPVYLVEGASDTLAMTAAGLACVGRPSNTGGGTLLAEFLRDWPADRGVVVVGENDRKAGGAWPGKAGADAVAGGLAGRLGRTVAVALPPAGAKDARDWLTAADRGEMPWPARGAALAAALAVAAEPVAPPAGSRPAAAGRPEITVGPDEYRVNEAAVAALAADPDVFQRGGRLVCPGEPDAGPDPAAVRTPPPAPAVRGVPRSLLRERLTVAADWFQWRGTGENAERVPTHPPDWCVNAVHDRAWWPGVRELCGVTAFPVVLPDGSVLADSGYHPGTRLLARIPPGLTVAVPARPTASDAAAAAARILDVVGDVPFAAPAHRAAFLAGLLTPLAWYLFDGPAPLFLIDGNARGVGKGLLADVAALTVTGRRFPVMSYTPDREELRKKITTLAVEGARMVLLDNLAGAVGNDVLDAALTADTWKDRLLGSNAGYDGPLHVVWFGTGNNVQLHADTSRRVCHVRLETADERPEVRGGFRHPDLRGHVRASRPGLLAAALTVLRAWHVAGRPAHGLSPWGSFEGWSGVVREAVVFAGLPDPGETREALQAGADRDAAAMAAVIAGLVYLDPGGRGLTTAEFVARVRDTFPAPDAVADARAAVEDLCGKLCGRTLGYKLRGFARRNFGGRMVDKAGEAGTGATRWRVVRAGGLASALPATPAAAPAGPGPGDAGDAGDVPAGAGAGPRVRYRNDPGRGDAGFGPGPGAV